MACFYANENFPRPVVEALRELGHDVVTSHEAGNANQRIPDEEVLQYACAQGRVLLTLNRRDFIRLHRRQPDHTGIVVCTVDADYPALAGRIHEQVRAAHELTGQLLRVNKAGQSQR